MTTETLLGQLAQSELLATIRIDADPVPASRPRVTKWGVYYLKTYATWMKVAKSGLQKGWLKLPPTVPLFVVVHSIGDKPRTSKRHWPLGDVDNLAKGPLDVITQATGWWTDDDQITALLSTKRWTTPSESPHTLIELRSAT